MYERFLFWCFRGRFFESIDRAVGSICSVCASAIAAIASALPKSVIGVVGDFDRENNRGIGLLVQALKTDGRTKILSTPSVITLDNEEANLSVGEQVPFPSGSYASTNNSNSINPFTTVNREDVGVMLKVKPQISKGNAVRLEIEQESSKVKAGDHS